MRYRPFVTLGAVAALGLTGALAARHATAQQSPAQQPPAQQTPGQNPNDWLLNAPDDTTRFRLLQGQASGFHVSMLAVGQRYQALYDAVGDGNFAFAAYQWEKIRELIQTGYQRRPLRRPNADREFVEKVYAPVLEALRSNDQTRAWAAFAEARSACMACHEAERVAFMNDQPMFRRTVAPRN